jgi:hypothetical protein
MEMLEMKSSTNHLKMQQSIVNRQDQAQKRVSGTDYTIEEILHSKGEREGGRKGGRKEGRKEGRKTNMSTLLKISDTQSRDQT